MGGHSRSYSLLQSDREQVTSYMVYAFGARGTIALLCYVNFLIFLNRGIIPGAPESFQHFISKSLGVAVSSQNFYLGLLSSVYVASTALFSLVFGFLSFNYKPFQLISCGLCSWILGAVVSALASHANSFHLLVLGRLLCGAGEASFQCNAMPFINRNAPKENSTLWLGIFIASITVGMAGGYVFGSSLASSSVGWAGAFYIEAALMIPALTCSTCAIPDELNNVPTDKSPVTSSVAGQIWGVFANIPFTLVAFGYAAYTFTLGCFSTFSPTLLMGLGFFKSETDVSLSFGTIAVVSGTVGTVLGGLALDRLAGRNTVSPSQRSKIAVDMLFSLLAIATTTGLVMMLFTNSKEWFMAWLAITYMIMAAIGPAETVAVMELFPESHQAVAVAINTAVILVFGDVPSPLVLGWLKDAWAPHCSTMEVEGEPQLNPDCHLDRSGIRSVLLFSVLWLVWGVLLWGAAKYILRRPVSNESDTKRGPVKPIYLNLTQAIDKTEQV